MNFERICGPCTGLGYYRADPRNTCKVCSGRGELEFDGRLSDYRDCRNCQSRGFYGINPEETCVTCEGRGLIRRQTPTQANLTVNKGPESDRERHFMELAIEEARKSIDENDGRPHPKVGVVVVKDGTVTATAHRGETGEGDHAEYGAL